MLVFFLISEKNISNSDSNCCAAGAHFDWHLPVMSVWWRIRDVGPPRDCAFQENKLFMFNLIFNLEQIFRFKIFNLFKKHEKSIKFQRKQKSQKYLKHLMCNNIDSIETSSRRYICFIVSKCGSQLAHSLLIIKNFQQYAIYNTFWKANDFS